MEQSPSHSPVKVDHLKSVISKRTDFSIDTLLKKQCSAVASNSSSASNCNSEEDDVDVEDGHFLLEENHRRKLALSVGQRNLSLMEKSGGGKLVDGGGRGRYVSESEKEMATFSWLACTRFKPPKLPRSKKKGGCVRHGRGPRIPFAPHQISVLEATFSKSQYLSSDCISRLADTLHLSETRVKIWFQNRRARYRRERESGATSTPSSVSSPTTTTHQTGSPNFKTNNNNRRSTSPVKLSLGDVGAIPYTHPSDISSDELYNPRKYFSNGNGKRNKLSIPDFISMQIQHHRQTQQQIQYYLQQANSPLLQSALQSTAAAAAAGFPFQPIMAEMSGGFGGNGGTEAAMSQIPRYLCANGNNSSSNSSFAPSTPIQISFP